MFSGMIAENISYGMPKAAREEIHQCWQAVVPNISLATKMSGDRVARRMKPRLPRQSDPASLNQSDQQHDHSHHQQNVDEATDGSS